MPVITADDAPVFETSGNVITALAAPSRGANDAAAWRIRLAADNPSVAHTLTREETFIVLAGTLTARFDDHDESAAAGGALIVPAGRRFHLVAEDGPAEAVCMLPVGGQAIVDGAPFTPPWAE